ncbi:acidic fibroblast growth factor binding protein, partial [Blyttiomyces helicus]
QFRNYEILEPHLHAPKNLATQLLLPLPPATKSFLVHSYYAFNDRVVRELLGRRLTSRARKDLDEVGDRTRVPVGGCRRMFDNLKRVGKRVEDMEGDWGAVVGGEFLLPPELSSRYANVLFICNNRLDTSKKKLAYLRLSDFEYVASIFIRYFTTPTTSALLELDASLAQDARDLKAIMLNTKETIEELRNIVSSAATPPIFPLPAAAFKALLRNALSIASGLSHSKELRDVFISLQEKIVDPCAAGGYGPREMDVFFAAVAGAFGSVAGLHLHTRRRYAASYGRIIEALRKAGVRMRAAAIAGEQGPGIGK